MNGDKAAEGSVEGGASKASLSKQKRRWLKREALQISSMLPEDPAEAAIVLGYLHDLQVDFLSDDEDDEMPDRGSGRVIEFPR